VLARPAEIATTFGGASVVDVLLDGLPGSSGREGTMDNRRLEGHMNADELKKLTIETLDRLGAALTEGQSERLTALLKTMAQFHRYSFHNVCLIARQRPDATRVAGSHAWRRLGRFVCKGEKGIAILAPIVCRKGANAVEDDGKTIVGFRAAYVFDVAQTNGAPLPEVAEPAGDPGEATDRLRAAIGSHGFPSSTSPPSTLRSERPAGDAFRPSPDSSPRWTGEGGAVYASLPRGDACAPTPRSDGLCGWLAMQSGQRTSRITCRSFSRRTPSRTWSISRPTAAPTPSRRFFEATPCSCELWLGGVS
jgi:hypothetical protein